MSEPSPGERCRVNIGSCPLQGAYSAVLDVCCFSRRVLTDVTEGYCCGPDDRPCLVSVAALLRGPEVCDGVDNDCNGVIDDVPPDEIPQNGEHCEECFDAACDRLAFATSTLQECIDRHCVSHGCMDGSFDRDGDPENGCETYQDQIDDDSDGSPLSEDCNDADATIRPGAREICNGVDEDCNGAVDETGVCAGRADPCATVSCFAAELCVDGFCRADQDGDGDAVPADCDDQDPRVGPTAVELCDNRDNDCDEAVDETCDYSQSCADVEPDSLEFGLVVGYNYPTRTFTLRNCGQGPTWVFGLEYEGDPADFYVGFPREMPIELDELSVDVAFETEQPGVRAATLHIATSDPERPELTVRLSGEWVEE